MTFVSGSRGALALRRVASVFVTVFAASFVVGNVAAAAVPSGGWIDAAYGKLPLSFEPTHGHSDAGPEYRARGQGYGLFLMPGKAVMALSKSPPRHADQTAAMPKAVAISMQLVGGNRSGRLEGAEPLPGKANYFIGNDPRQWRTDVPTYAKVIQRDAYRGIDVHYYGNQRRLEYDFIVAPRVDPRAIRLEFGGVDRVVIDSAGNLKLGVGTDEVRMLKPVLYQMVNGARKEVRGSYAIRGDRQVGFRIGRYDRSRTLIIDPVMIYNTYLGGTGNDYGTAIAVDSLGHAYVGGYTNSVDVPATPTAPQPAFASNNGLGNPDGFVTKLNPAGNGIVYSTYLGGTCTDIVFGITVNAAGEAYVTGTTGSGLNGGTTPDCFPFIVNDPNFNQFPLMAAFQPAYGGSSDAFITKISAAGNALVYSSFLGGQRMEFGTAVAVDASGDAYVTGDTLSPDFPVTAGVFQVINNGSLDAFVTKVTKTGAVSALVYSTYLGGGGLDRGRGITVDGSGDAYVAGQTDSGSVNGCNIQTTSPFPTTPGAFQPSIAPSPPVIPVPIMACGAFPGGVSVIPNMGDAFVSRLNSGGTALVYSTYLGGGIQSTPLTSANDEAHAIAIDASGNAYVTGYTTASNFPTMNAYQSSNQGGQDAFITKLNPAGSALLYSTYFGGAGTDEGNGIAVNGAGEAYVAGTTAGGMPAIDPIPGCCGIPIPMFPQTTGGGAFVAKFDASGSAPIYSTSILATASGHAIAIDSAGDAYITGQTNGGLDTVSAYQSTPPGLGDAFVTKLGAGAPATQPTTTNIVSDNPDPSVVGQNVVVAYTVTASSGTPTGNVTVTASTMETCTATVAAGSCTLTFATTGIRTLTASYAGTTGFAPSSSTSPETHNVVVSATFTVNKAYSDSNTAPVSITLTCTSGTASPSAAFAAPGSPAMFTVTGHIGDPTCQATETLVPAGYVGSGTPAGTCNAALSVGACTITNSPITATFEVRKVYSDANTTPVQMSLQCASGAVTPPFAGASPGNPAIFTVTGYSGNPMCTATETVPAGYTASGTPAGTCDALLTGTNNGTCTITNTLKSATFTVNKAYSDSNTTPVSITLSCDNNGTVTQPTKNASPGNPAVFTVTGYNNNPTCTATESGVPAGYTGSGSPPGTCNGPLEPNGNCTITNTLNSATFTVNKVFSDNNPASVTVSLNCGTGNTVTPASTTMSQTTPATFTVTGYSGNPTCTATETVPPGYIGSGTPPGTCNAALTAGTCTITNTTRSTFEVRKAYTNGDMTPVSVTLACSTGTVSPASGSAAPGSPAIFTVTGHSGPATCTATETIPSGYNASGIPAGTCNSTLSSGSCTITNSPVPQTFKVDKAYDDGNTLPVSISLICASGTVTPSSASAAPGFPATFTVTNYLGNPTCTATETVPPGYTGSGTPPGTCSAALATSGTCMILNTLNTATFTVQKVFSDNSPDSVTVSLNCGIGNTVTPASTTMSQAMPASFTVSGYDGNPTCTATEVVPAGYTGSGTPPGTCNSPLSPNGTCTITNTRIPFATGGVFVIGNLTPQTPGTKVNFWGAQWARNNPLTDGPAPPEFKGFENTSPALACGGTWKSDPGNSSGPPATIASVMAVVVSSKITRNGSVISGDIKKIVLVEPDPGYARTPGKEGTGKVLSVLCEVP